MQTPNSGQYENPLRMTLGHEYGHYADSRIMPRFPREAACIMEPVREMSA